MVVPHRWVVLDGCNPSESAVDAYRDATAHRSKTALALGRPEGGRSARQWVQVIEDFPA